MIMDDYDGQMIFGDRVGLKLPDIRFTGEEKPRKNLTQETCPDRQVRILPLAPQRWTWPETVAPIVSARNTGNHLLTAGLRSRVPLTRLPLIPQNHQAQLFWCRKIFDWRVEWRSVVFSDEGRLCLYANDGRTRVRSRHGERHLPECIRPRTQTPPQASWSGCHQLQLAVTFGVSAG